MSEIKRYSPGLISDIEGEYVVFADHESALASAVEAERDRVIKEMVEPLMDEAIGYRDFLADQPCECEVGFECFRCTSLSDVKKKIAAVEAQIREAKK